MDKRMVTSRQKSVSDKINGLIKTTVEKPILNESIDFNHKGKYPVINFNKINHLAKFSLNEGTTLNAKNIKLIEYGVDLDKEECSAVFFALPTDEDAIETKNGREILFKLEDLANYIESHCDVKSFHTKDLEDNTFFDFDKYWGTLNNLERTDDIKDFISFTLKKSGQLPELT